MHNYRGNSNDYMRRGSYGRSRDNCGSVPLSMPQQPFCGTSPRCEQDDMLEGMPLAMAYVPWQNWRKIYEPEKAFHTGTIFEELDKPFLGRGGCNQ